MNRSTGGPWSSDQPTDPRTQQARMEQAALAIQRLAELGVDLADVRQALVDALADLPMEAAWVGFQGPLTDLDRIALQLDTLYTELMQLLGLPRPPL